MQTCFLRSSAWCRNKIFLFVPKHKKRYPVNVPMQPIPSHAPFAAYLHVWRVFWYSKRLFETLSTSNSFWNEFDATILVLHLANTDSIHCTHCIVWTEEANKFFYHTSEYEALLHEFVGNVSISLRFNEFFTLQSCTNNLLHQIAIYCSLKLS